MTGKHRFTGQESEQELGLYYYGARFYDPDLGRFLQVDPARENWSSYLYVANNPINSVDPTGMYEALYLNKEEIAAIDFSLNLMISSDDPVAQFLGNTIVESDIIISKRRMDNGELATASFNFDKLDFPAKTGFFTPENINEAFKYLQINIDSQLFPLEGDPNLANSLVHEGVHAMHNAMAILTFFGTEQYGPTTSLQTEFLAHKTQSEFLMSTGLVNDKRILYGSTFKSDQAIYDWLANPYIYNLTEQNPGPAIIDTIKSVYGE